MRNLEAVEIGLREAVYRDLCAILEELLNDPALPVPEDYSRAGEKCHAKRPKEFLSLFGPVPLHRNYYHSQAKQTGRAPLDQALGLWAGYSPGVLRVLCRLAARFPFEIAAAEFKAYCGLKVEGRQIQRVTQDGGPLVRQVQQQLPPFKHDSGTIPVLYTAVDGTGVPMMPSELEGRVGKQPDGSAKTREVKLGCIFTQTTTDEEGLPLRDYQSTSYVAGFEEAADFMVRVRQEAIRRRMAAALLVVLLGDGAAWIWEQGQKCFPMAFQILDLYHALEHLSALTKLLEAQPQAAKALWQTWREQLLADEVAEVLRQARERSVQLSGEPADLASKEIGYFQNNQSRMLYGTYRALGFFYGSGVVEAGCKTVIGGRCKGSGMLWSEPGATHVLDLRCSLFGNQFDQVWDQLNQSDYLRLRILEHAEDSHQAA
ncbi:MAG TPA: ISKra4 family transposase [Verrucomicrobiae bacterium]|nr:ISKra4 family transposase [Verrucomicrobiae bacterium]